MCFLIIKVEKVAFSEKEGRNIFFPSSEFECLCSSNINEKSWKSNMACIFFILQTMALGRYGLSSFISHSKVASWTITSSHCQRSNLLPYQINWRLVNTFLRCPNCFLIFYLYFFNWFIQRVLNRWSKLSEQNFRFFFKSENLKKNAFNKTWWAYRVYISQKKVGLAVIIYY